MPKRITQKDIAREIGVSRATVSYVLAGCAKKHRVSGETEKKVLEVAQRLNYVPNGIARSLRNQRTNTIGVMLASFESDWAHRLHMGIERVTEQAGYTPIFMPRFWSAERERREIDWLLERRVDGLVVCIALPENRAYYRRLIRQGFPIVFAGDTLPGLQGASVVWWNSPEAVRTVIRHFAATGRKRIAFCGWEHGTEMTARRYQAYEETIKDLGLPARPEWVFWGSHSRATASMPGHLMMSEWITATRALPKAQRPDAYFGMNDSLAMAVYRDLVNKGIDVPGEAAIAGLGDISFAHEDARLTTVSEPISEYGEHATRLLLEQIADPAREPSAHTIESAELIVRSSSVAHAPAMAGA